MTSIKFLVPRISELPQGRKYDIKILFMVRQAKWGTKAKGDSVNNCSQGNYQVENFFISSNVR
jgi:hypothetical protein